MKKVVFVLLVLLISSCTKVSTETFQVRNNTSQKIVVSIVNVDYMTDKDFEVPAYSVVQLYANEYAGEMYDYRPYMNKLFTDSTMLIEYNKRIVMIPEINDGNNWEYEQIPAKKFSKYGNSVYTFTIGYEMLQ